jgi:hypothetical protein
MWGAPVLRILAAICVVFAVSNELHGQPKGAGAPPTQVDEWKDYRDRYGLIHTEIVKNGEPSTGNGLLYTAYACVSMQLRNISYDKDQMAEAIRNSQVKPGLFGRGPSKLNDQNAHDDYRGLGAIAAICGLPHVANDILKYGRGPDQPSGASVLGLNKVDFGPFGEEVRQCTSIFYNYNNVTPGKYTRDSWLDSWFGRYPDLITHLKIASGNERPTAEELVVWAAWLVHSGATAKTGDTTPWLLSWIQVLTYKLSAYRSSAADAAVSEWYRMLRARYPQGGIKQAMKEVLKGEAERHPLGKYIDNFENVRNPNAMNVSSEDFRPIVRSLLRPDGGIVSTDCGSGAVCLKFNGFSPANFVTPFRNNLVSSEQAVAKVKQSLTEVRVLLKNQASAEKQALEIIASVGKTLVELEGQHANLFRELESAIAKHNDMITRGLHLVTPPGICVRQPCRVCPPITVPCALAKHPEFDRLLRSINDLEGRVKSLVSRILEIRQQLHAAELDVAVRANLTVLQSAASFDQRMLEINLSVLETAEATHRAAQGIIGNIIPCAKRLP